MWNANCTASGSGNHWPKRQERRIAYNFSSLSHPEKTICRAKVILWDVGIARIFFPLYKYEAGYAYGTSNISAGVGAERLPKSSEQPTVSTPDPLH